MGGILGVWAAGIITLTSTKLNLLPAFASRHSRTYVAAAPYQAIALCRTCAHQNNPRLIVPNKLQTSYAARRPFLGSPEHVLRRAIYFCLGGCNTTQVVHPMYGLPLDHAVLPALIRDATSSSRELALSDHSLMQGAPDKPLPHSCLVNCTTLPGIAARISWPLAHMCLLRETKQSNWPANRDKRANASEVVLPTRR